MTDAQLAERLARSDWGDGWKYLTKRTRAERIEIWLRLIEAIRVAGLAVVEAEDGR